MIMDGLIRNTCMSCCVIYTFFMNYVLLKLELYNVQIIKKLQGAV